MASPLECVDKSHSTSSNMLNTSTPSCTFLETPPEIRNIIYRYVLVSAESPINVNKLNLKNRKALLDTCAQIKDEATAVFFGENDFCITCTLDQDEGPGNWVKSLGKHIRLIKKMIVKFDFDSIAHPIVMGVYSQAFAAQRAGGSIHRPMSQSYVAVTERMSDAICTANAIGNALQNGWLERLRLDIQTPPAASNEEDDAMFAKALCEDALHDLFSVRARATSKLNQSPSIKKLP